MMDLQHRWQVLPTREQRRLHHYQFTSEFRSQPYTKMFAFSSPQQLESHQSELVDIVHLLNTYLAKDDQTPEGVEHMIRIVNRYGRKWGYLRVPANVRHAVNYKQATAGLRLTDYGTDSGVTEGVPYEVPSSFGPNDNAEIVFSVAECVPTTQVIHQYNCSLGDAAYEKDIPCVDAEEEEDFVNQTRNMYRQMLHLGSHLRPSTKVLLRHRRSAMKKVLSKAYNYVRKWGLARVPGNVRNSINLFEFILSEQPYTDFGPDTGVLAGSAPYENINVETRFEAVANAVL